ncbi:carbonic anhydrase [Candidatus Symbiobacter mobilis CR]|uniref:carbonic anhydrase n=2 Tax=Candidatus Symbiobacter TaxID=1436289 RepID=U5NEN9_9BURK|nr:carbonic anhydrase [Candidatus Symbiobacter mobilis CR]
MRCCLTPPSGPDALTLVRTRPMTRKWGLFPAALMLACSAALAADHAPGAHVPVPAAHGKVAAAPKPAAHGSATGSGLTDDIERALKEQHIEKKRLTLVITEPPPPPPRPAPAMAHPAAAKAKHAPRPAVANTGHNGHPVPSTNAPYGHAAPVEHGAHGHGDVHWSYSGDTGPHAWGRLKPEFATCATGKRQAPINIETSSTLLGPAEPLQFDYHPSGGTVTNNGHSIQVDVYGENILVVRGVAYRLIQFHFHAPSEEQINFRSFPMVAHLVHKSADDRLAVIAVLLDQGTANPLIDKVWTYMPLDMGDTVRMPQDIVDVNELLPKDRRYYQFLGSLTTPPCTEGVLWMVLKQATTLSREQIRMFQQLYPQNARPVQPLNGRVVRDAQ